MRNYSCKSFYKNEFNCIQIVEGYVLIDIHTKLYKLGSPLNDKIMCRSNYLNSILCSLN